MNSDIQKQTQTPKARYEYIHGQCPECKNYGSWELKEGSYISCFCDCQSGNNEVTITDVELEDAEDAL